MLRRFYICCIAICALISCHTDITDEPQEQNPTETIYASIEQFRHNRTTLGSDNSILWSSGDRISVFKHRSFNDEYILDEVASGTNEGEFSLIPSFTDGLVPIVPLLHSVAFYPYVSRLTCNEIGNDDGYSIDGFVIPKIQKWVAESFDPYSFPMVAVSESPNILSFRNICGILKLCFTGSGSVKRLRLMGNKGEALAGESLLTVYGDERKPEISICGDSFSEVILDCGDGVCLDPEHPTSFMFSLPPVDFDGGFTVEVEYDGGKVVEVSTSKNNPVLRSMILRMPDINLDDMEDDSIDDMQIVFEDPVVERVFISRFDKDDDNSLSMKEVAAVAEISSFFFGEDASDVKSLDDLSQFNSLVSLADDAFNGCTALESVVMPVSLASIGSRAFAGCSSLCEITLNEGLVSIANEAFRSCYNLFEINIPDSVESIGEGTFKDCINLEGFTGRGVLSDGRTLISDDVLISYAFSGQARFAYHIPAEVSKIGEGAFYNCRNLTGLVSHAAVEVIGDYAFYGCGLLSDVDLADGLRSIGMKTFARCFALSKLSLPESLEYIGYYAFAERAGIEELRVNSTVPPYVDVALFDTVPTALTVYVPDSSLSEYLAATGWRDLRYYMHGVVPDDGGGEFDDYLSDGEVTVLQKAQRGNGIDVVLMGDAFARSDIEDGTYTSYMEQASEALFSVEPYTSYKDLFNVYSVAVVSERSGYTSGTGRLETFFGEGTHVGGNDETVMEYAMNVLTEDDMDDALIIVLLNREYYAGTCYMYYPPDGDYGRGLSIAYFPLGTDDEMFAELLQHEAGGHGFAKLDDEYYYDGTIPSEEITRHKWLSGYGWSKNVDITSNRNKVKWRKFIDDGRYSVEGIGIFEGASTYQYGVYRPTEDSIMNQNQGGFNAPSREAIWYRMHKLAFGSSWEYDFEEFVEYDMVNLTGFRARECRTRTTGVELPPLSPPVIRTCSWRDFIDKKHSNL